MCPLSERGCRHPLLFAVLDLLVLLDQAKSTRKESVRRKLFERSFAMRKLLCASRNDDYLLVSCFSRSPACRIALRKERKDSYAPLHSVRNDKSCHPQEKVQTNSDTGIDPCIAPQTAEKKAVSDRFSAHLPENRKIIRNFAGQSINCRARI